MPRDQFGETTAGLIGKLPLLMGKRANGFPRVYNAALIACCACSLRTNAARKTFTNSQEPVAKEANPASP